MDRRKSVLFLRHGFFSPRGFFRWQGATVWEKRKSAAKLIMDSEGWAMYRRIYEKISIYSAGRCPEK